METLLALLLTEPQITATEALTRPALLTRQGSKWQPANARCDKQHNIASRLILKVYRSFPNIRAGHSG
jgi:hypothetical protein